MNKETQDLAWSVLPKEFKEEVRRMYRIADSDVDQMIATIMLENIFGIHNLDSNVEGEEMLMVSRKEVNDLFNRYERCYKETNGKCHDMEVALKESHFFGKMCALFALFGTKCMPDIKIDSERLVNTDKESIENSLLDRMPLGETSDGSSSNIDSLEYLKPKANGYTPIPEKTYFSKWNKNRLEASRAEVKVGNRVKPVLLIIWMIFLFGVLSFGYDLINKSSTVGNIAGVITLAVFALMSIKTKCFTSIIIKSKSK